MFRFVVQNGGACASSSSTAQARGREKFPPIANAEQQDVSEGCGAETDAEKLTGDLQLANQSLAASRQECSELNALLMHMRVDVDCANKLADRAKNRFAVVECNLLESEKETNYWRKRAERAEVALEFAESSQRGRVEQKLREDLEKTLAKELERAKNLHELCIRQQQALESRQKYGPHEISATNPFASTRANFPACGVVNARRCYRSRVPNEADTKSME